MIKLILFFFILSLSACGTTKVSTKKEPEFEYCGSTHIQRKEGIHKYLMSQNKDISFRDLSKRDHTVFLNAYNSTSPPSQVKADKIRFYYRLGFKSVFMVMSVKSCVSQAGPINLSQLEAWLQGFVLVPNSLKKTNS